MKELLLMAGKLIESFGVVASSLKRVADSLEGIHYEAKGTNASLARMHAQTQAARNQGYSEGYAIGVKTAGKVPE